MNRKILLPLSSATFFLLAACSQETSQPADANTNGDMSISESSSLSCTTKNLADKSGIKIICDGDSIGVVYNGKNGTNGKDGKDGKDGVDGTDGIDGVDGRDGRNGAEGASCTIESIEGTDSHKVLCDGDSVGVLYNGENGSDGKTAYEIAVDNGFNGTEEEWLASLKGEKGDKGDKGETGATGEKGDKGDTGEKGADGMNGKDGTDGKNGTNGVGCTSTAVTDTETGKTGVKVQCGSEDAVYVWNGTDGAKGEKGDKGDAGEKGDKGDAGDDGKNGVDGTNGTNGTNGTDGKNGTNGTDGTNGKSAFQIAVDNGFEGTEEEWLASLKGEKGDDGDDGAACYITDNSEINGFNVYCGGVLVGTLQNGADGKNGKDGTNGKSAYQIAVDNGFEGTEEEWLASLKGDKGADGKNGTNGAGCTATTTRDESTGLDGIMVQCGNNAPVYVWNGANGTDGGDGNDGLGCSSTTTTDAETGLSGVIVQCGTSEPVTIWDGKDGEDGSDGEDGENGTSCTAEANEEINGYDIICNNVKVGEIKNGKDGKDGENGTGGTSGSSCTAAAYTDSESGRTGVAITCGTNEPVIVWNGTDGKDGKDGTDGENGNDGESCSVKDTTDTENNRTGAKIVCGSSTTLIWNGANGTNGKDGEDGENGNDGESCSVKDTTDTENNRTGVKITCSQNSSVVWNGTNGQNGGQGEQGPQGEQGVPGTSCTASAYTDEETGRTGVAITCGTNEPVIVWDGKDGKDAEAASSSSSDESSSSIEESSSSEEVLSDACLEMRATTNTFFPIQNVFGCVKSTEKVVFIVRHAERNKDDTGSEKSLNSNGFSQANYVGQNISKLNLDEDIYYWHTGARRTMETASRISRGAGESNFFDESTFGNCNGSDKGKNENANCINEHHEYNNDMVGSWFDKCDGEGDDWKTYAKAAYEPEKCENSTKPDVVAKTNDFVNTYIKNKFNDLHKYTIAISHDQFILSAVAAISNRQIDFNYHNYNWGQTGFMHWPNYLAGLAVIINEAKDVIYIPVRGLNSGFFGDHCKNGFENGYPCSVWP